MVMDPLSPPAASAMYRIAGRTYPLKTVRNCPVCSSAFRPAIENYLILGYSIASIVQNLPPDSAITSAEITRHHKGKHMPLQEDVRRSLIERRATELKWDPEAESRRLDDHITFLRMGVHDVMTRMATRELEPDIKDGIQMARVLAAIDIDSDTEKYLSSYVTSIRIMLELTKEIMSEDQFLKFSHMLMQDPNMARLMSPDPQRSEIVVGNSVTESDDVDV
jgi:hypothetical protein